MAWDNVRRRLQSFILMSCPSCLRLSRIPTTNLQLRVCLVAHVLLSDVALPCSKWLLIAPPSLAVTPTHKKPVVTKHNTSVHSNRVWNIAGTMTACGNKTWEPHVSNPTMVASPARSLAPRHCRSTRDQTRVTHLWSLHLRPHAHAPSAAARARPAHQLITLKSPIRALSPALLFHMFKASRRTVRLGPVMKVDAEMASATII